MISSDVFILLLFSFRNRFDSTLQLTLKIRLLKKKIKKKSCCVKTLFLTDTKLIILIALDSSQRFHGQSHQRNHFLGSGYEYPSM